MKVKRPKETERFLTNYYSVDQLVELFEISKDCRIYTPIILAGLLGLRRSEIIGLKWEAINFSAGTISIKRKAVKDKASNKDIISSKLKTAFSYRILPLPFALLDYLKRLKKHQARQAKSPSYSKDYLKYICLKSNGTRITLDEVTNGFHRLIQRHGLDKILFHDLRHSCATMLLHLNYSMKQIQEWLGHSNYQTTANIYTHVSVKDKEDMANTINNSIKMVL